MKSLLFNPEKRFDSSPNKLIPINPSYSMKEKEYAFGRLAKTNIFIGENNSGKSRFLRSLFLNNFYAIDKDDIERFYQSLKKDLSYDQKREFETINFNDRFNYLYEKLGELRSYYSNVANGFFASLQDCSSLISHSNKYYFSTIRGVKDYRYIIDKKLNEFIKSEKSIQNTDPIYHYLSLLNLKDEGLPSFDIYREMISHEYFASARSSLLNILTGGQLYNTIKAMLLGDAEERKNIMDFQDFLCEKFFAEYEKVQLIPKEAEKVLYVKIGDDERPIYDWGDGTQQLIIILFSLFVHKDEKDRMFFIEEPEIYLHPGMLRRFIEVINSDVFPYHQYFITTHSNAILDISADTNVNMSIFKFKKKRDLASSEPQFEIEQCNNGDASLLNELGVRNSSVFLTNCSIWVEGITDRLYLKHYINLYFQHQGVANPFRENIDYTFIEYGGNNLVHFNFDPLDSKDKINTRYISNHIFLIADNDNTREGTKKDERKKHLKKVLGEHFYELSVIEIENLLPQKAIEETLMKQNPEHIALIKQKFTKERNYKTTKLGSYLDHKLFKDSGLKKYSATSGTIKEKINFCKAAISFITDYETLTEEAKDLVEKIVAFIKENNQ